MDFVPNELLVFLTRWAHVIAGIAWIGNSFYFMWLDANLELPEQEDEISEGSLWMVHSGGFYQVERRKITPATMPKILHWFKWEATLTWVTGFFLFSLVFYTRGAALLINPELVSISPVVAIGISLGILAGAWIVYDLFWNSRFVKNIWLANAISLGLGFGLIYICTLLFSGRGAFIQIGAVFGTLMVLNVWVRILPAQTAMIAATKRGEKADFSLAAIAKLRSTHNSYMTLPVLFAMLGGHFAQASNHEINWFVIILFVLLGMFARHIMILRTKSLPYKVWFAPLGINLVVLVGMLNWPFQPAVSQTGEVVTELEAINIVQTRCVSCHAKDPIDKTFGPMPGGVAFESLKQVESYADRIYFMAVETKTMPLANKTEMTEDERKKLGRWIKQVVKK